jgi:hypothetical protein
MKKHRRINKKQIKEHFERNLDYDWMPETNKYSKEAIHKVFLHAALDKTSIEDSAQWLQEKTGGYGSSPSADSVFRSLNKFIKQCGEADLGAIEYFTVSNLQQNLENHPEFLLWQSQPAKDRNIAIDLHEEPYYGEPLITSDKKLLTPIGQGKSTRKRRVLSYATLSLVFGIEKARSPITIGFLVCYKGLARDQEVHTLLEQCKALKISFTTAFLDGGFYSSLVCKYLSQYKIPFLIRARFKLTNPKKYGIDKFGKPSKRVKNRYRYVMNKSKKAKRYEVVAYQIKFKQADQKMTKIYFIGPTWQIFHIKDVLNMYKVRFRIENTYRASRTWKIRTSTRNYHIRALMFGFTAILEQAWELQTDAYYLQGLEYNYSMRQRRVARILREAICEAIPPAEYEYHPGMFT